MKRFQTLAVRFLFVNFSVDLAALVKELIVGVMNCVVKTDA